MTNEMNPAPAVGQVWSGHVAYQSRDVTWVVAEVGAVVMLREDGHTSLQGLTFEALRRSFRCIGVETPAGRVTVGEKREPQPDVVLEVCHVCEDSRAWLSDGVEGWPETAATVAVWPLVLVCSCSTAMYDRGCAKHGEMVRRAEEEQRQQEAEHRAKVSIIRFGLPAPGSLPWIRYTAAHVCGCPESEIIVTGTNDGRVRVEVPIGAPGAENAPRLYAALRDNLPGDINLTVSSRTTESRAASLRVSRRAEISAVLAEDARRRPAFALARSAAILSECEPGANAYSDVFDGARAHVMLDALHIYEERRGGGRQPSMSAAAMAAWNPHEDGKPGDPMFVAYERARSL